MPEAKYAVRLRVAHPEAAKVAASQGYTLDDDADDLVVKKARVVLSESELAALREKEPWAVIEPAVLYEPEKHESAIEGDKKAAEKKVSKKRGKKAASKKLDAED